MHNMARKEFEYSVIIPHKNSPKLLQRLLNSIPRRDDLQIIVVDDNSDPEKVDFNKFPGLNDTHVELYFDKTGKGAGHARNVGLEHSKGKWLVFADADDYFYSNAFSVIDKKITEKNYDIIYFYCNSRDGDTGEIISDRLPNIKRGIDNNDYDLLRYKSYVPWGKVIKTELVKTHHICFEEIEASNDIMFSTKVGYYSSKVGTISDCLYCCTRNKSSLFFLPSNSRIKTRICAGRRINVFMGKHGIEGYRYDTIEYVFYFFPKQPLLFIWAVWNGRYFSNNVLYLSSILKMLFLKIRHRLIL